MTIDFRCVVKFGVGVGYQIELIANLKSYFENSLKKKSPILKIKISFEVIFFFFFDKLVSRNLLLQLKSFLIVTKKVFWAIF